MGPAPLAALRLVAAAALLAPAAGRAYVRSTTAAGHPEQGLCLWWATRAVPYQVNASLFLSVPGCADGAAAAALAEASLAAWAGATRTGEAQPCTDFAFTFDGTTSRTAIGNDGVNLLVFRAGYCLDVAAGDPCLATPGACAEKYGCWEHDAIDPGTGRATIALTTVSYDVATGRILDADMELHGWNGSSGGASGLPRGSYFTCTDPPAAICTNPPYLPAPQAGCIWIDVGNIATHEAGHMLGLDHTCTYPPPFDSCTPGGHTMDPTMIPGETAKRALSQDDVAGVCAVYPAGAPTSTCAPPARAGGGGCGCAAGGAGSEPLLAVLGLLAAGRRRLRRVLS